MESVKCTNCEWEGSEDNLTLVEFNGADEKEVPTATENEGGFIHRLAVEPLVVDYLKGCPKCLTDNYLMDL